MFFLLSKVIFFIIRPSNFLLILLGVGVFFLFGKRQKMGRGLVLLSFMGFFAFGLGPLGNILMQPLEDRFQTPEKVGQIDGIIVLGGAIDTVVTNTRPLTSINTAAERVTVVAQLAREHPKAKVIHSGGEGLLLGSGTSEAEGVLPLFLSFGIERERIVLEDQARNTWENATLTKEQLEPTEGQRWLLVTSAYHMPRSVGVFEAAGWTGIIPYPVDHRTRGPQDAGRWFVGLAEGLKRTDVAVKEWIGLIAYYATGRSTALFPSPQAS